MVTWIVAGIQHREAAVGGGREEEDQARVWAEGEASGDSKENVISIFNEIWAIRFIFLLVPIGLFEVGLFGCVLMVMITVLCD